ncbi:hypothetical protein O9929_06705 [Vibrio lentus]|nr:hypothetical protein [Vibrio lentus]
MTSQHTSDLYHHTSSIRLAAKILINRQKLTKAGLVDITGAVGTKTTFKVKSNKLDYRERQV